MTFKLSGPSDATYTVAVSPKNGRLVFGDRTVTWIPKRGFCEIGGNDGFVLRWVDSKGNRGTITKMIVLARQGDIPNMIRTGA